MPCIAPKKHPPKLRLFNSPGWYTHTINRCLIKLSFGVLRQEIRTSVRKIPYRSIRESNVVIITGRIFCRLSYSRQPAAIRRELLVGRSVRFRELTPSGNNHRR